jgi:hypothetical protein
VPGSRSQVDGDKRAGKYRRPNVPSPMPRRRMVEGRGPKQLGCGGSFQAANSGTCFKGYSCHNFGEEYRSYKYAVGHLDALDGRGTLVCWRKEKWVDRSGNHKVLYWSIQSMHGCAWKSCPQDRLRSFQLVKKVAYITMESA